MVNKSLVQWTPMKPIKVKYEIVDYIGYSVESDMFPNSTNINDFITKSTGEVMEFIKGGILTSDKFLICDDITHKFIKVDIDKCKRI